MMIMIISFYCQYFIISKFRVNCYQKCRHHSKNMSPLIGLLLVMHIHGIVEHLKSTLSNNYDKLYKFSDHSQLHFTLKFIVVTKLFHRNWMNDGEWQLCNEKKTKRLVMTPRNSWMPWNIYERFPEKISLVKSEFSWLVVVGNLLNKPKKKYIYRWIVSSYF